jgi:hypothetical protein
MVLYPNVHHYKTTVGVPKVNQINNLNIGNIIYLTNKLVELFANKLNLSIFV